MRTKIARYTSVKPADLIIDKLLSTQPAQVERGRNELDDHQFPKKVHALTVTLNQDILPGDMIEVIDTNLIPIWRGKVISVSISVGIPKISQTLKVERI